MFIPDLRINTQRLIDNLNHLSHIGKLPDGSVSRLALTDEDKQVRDQLVMWMKESGLDVRVDQVGNIFWNTGWVIESISRDAGISYRYSY